MLATAGVLTVTVAVAACSTDPAPSGSNGGDNRQTLTVATDNVEQLQPVVNAFEKANSGVTVEVQDGGSDYQAFLRTSIAAGNAADVIRIFPGNSGNDDSVVLLDGAGAVKNLSSDSWVSKLSPSQKALFSDKGKVVAVPIGSLALGPVYDDQTLQALGATVPKTFSQVLALCKTAKAAGKVAYAIFQKGGNVVNSFAMVAPLIYGPDPNFTTEQITGKHTFADSKWVQAFQLQLKMKSAGCFNTGPNGTDYNAAFAQVAKGQAVATIAFSDTSSLEQVSPKGTTFTIAPLPVDDNPDDLYLAVANSAGFAVNAKTKESALAQKFIDFLATPQGQNLFASGGNGAPAIPNDSFVPSNKNEKTLNDYLKSGKVATWPDQQWPGPSTDVALDDVSQTLFLSTDTPLSAAAKMDAAFEKDLKSLQSQK